MTASSSDIRHCRKCGAEFIRSRTDSTVNCPAHRGRPGTSVSAREAASKADEYYVKAGEARRRGVAARASGDDAAYQQAIADFTYWADRSAAARRAV